MSWDNALAEFELLIRAQYALIVIETVEPERADDLVRETATRLGRHYYYWTRSKGIRHGSSPGDPYEPDTAESVQALKFVEQDASGIYLFRDLTPFIEEPLVVSHLLDVARALESRRGALVIAGSQVKLPDALRPHATFFKLPAPTYDEYRMLVEKIIRDQSLRMKVTVELTREERVMLTQNLMGLTLVEAEKIVTRRIVEDGFLRAKDIEGVITAKRQAIQQDGHLEFYPPEHGLSAVAGLAGLKAWLTKRRAVVADPQRATEFGLRYPKGILLLGVPGCGKSMCAKAVATEWGLPLLKLDPGNLYDKYMGDSEKNFKRALQTAERMAPAILWIDELEKAFEQGGGETDGGVSRRVFGSFLSWLQDRKGDVFVVATSNDVSKLPPEFIRKGRFDEVFFVDLPAAAVRESIFGIHLKRRKQDVGHFDLGQLAKASVEFSGAEIEESVVSGLFTAFASGAPLSTAMLIEELRKTRPLAQTMTEKISELRAWAADRTVLADA